MSEKPKILVIVGPTASGKTSLSITLAKQFNGEVISADSRQVYTGLDIGTGKVTREEMAGIPHHLLDVADPKNTTFSVHDFVRDGRIALESILSRNKLPIIVGGTFLYIDALIGDVSVPEVPPNEDLRKELEKKDSEELRVLLETKDPGRVQTIDTKNKRRLIRAIEIATTLGTVPQSVPEPRYDVCTLGIAIDRDTLRKNIHTRLTSRLNGGMITEVQKLHADGLSYERLSELGIEYKYISEFLQGIITQDEMCLQIETKSMQYAKRQMTWLKRDQNIVWIDPHNAEHVMATVTGFLGRASV